MNILGIDTSSKGLGMSITNGESISFTLSLSGKERTSKIIVNAFKELLEIENLSISFIEGVSIITGPGSFTGLKLGMTFAKILSYTRKIPIVGVDLFDVISFNYKYLDEPIEILLPSRKGEFYYNRYLPKETLTSSSILKEDVLLDALEKDFWIYIPYQNLISMFSESGYKKLIPGWNFISKSYVAALLGIEKIKRGEMDDPYDIKPLYIRKFPF